MKRFVLFLVCLTLPTLSQAAGFDCAKASSDVEKLICATPELSRTDEILTTAYREALSAAGESKDSIRKAQVEWLQSSRNACKDVPCLQKAYASRLEALGKPMTQPPAAVSHPPAAIPAPAAATSPGVPPQEPVPPAVERSNGPEPVNTAAPSNPASPAATTTAASAPTNPKASPPPAPAGGETEPQEGSGMWWKVLIVLLALNAVLAIYLHKQEKIVIYSNYTDATFTGVAPAIVLGVFFVMRWIGISDKINYWVAGVLAVGFLVIIVRETMRNNGKGLAAFMVLAAKLTVVLAYYAIMIYLLLARFSQSPRKKGERTSTYEARLRREAREKEAQMAAATASLLAFSAMMCRDSFFLPFEEYLTGRSDADSLASESIEVQGD